jgi:TolB-like protein
MSFFAELKRRNVVRVGIAYVIVGWLLAQVAEFAVEAFGAPDWVLKIFVVFLVLGLPLALFFAWAFELTPEGLKLEKHVDRDESITPQTGRKLDFIIIAVMAIALIYMVADKFIGEPEVRDVTESVVPDDKSIAVLPFVNMSDDKDYFADGLSEELLNLLAKIPDLRVIGRTSSFAFKGKNQDLRVIGDALGVSTVLEGSVRRSGDRLRITAQLINTDDGSHLWSETYDREMADIFDIQDDVANAITTALQLHLVSDTVVKADRSTQNTDAYALYLESLAMVREGSDPLATIEVLNRALELDPKFVRGHEQKAILYWTAAGWDLDSPTAQQLVYDSAKTAFEIDPSSIVAQTFMATADPIGWTWSIELDAIERALREMPENFSLLHSYCWDLGMVGYFREALQCSDRMIGLEPLAALGYERKAVALIAMGRRAEAQEAWRKSADFGFEIDLINHVFDYLLHGQDEEAMELVENLPAGQDREIVGMDAGDFRSFVESARNPDSGRQYLRDTVPALAASASNHYDAINANIWYLAFDALDDYYDVIYKMNEVDTSWTNSDMLAYVGRAFKSSGYTEDPRFTPLRNRWGMLDLWDERGPPDDCEKVDDNWVCN